MVRTVLRELGATALLAGRALSRRPPTGATRRQVVDLFVRTLPLNLAAMAFVGAVVVVDGGRQVQRLFGDPAGLGPAVLELVVRIFGPTFGGVIAATRIGSGVAAEVAALKVSEQVDALELGSVDVVAELVSARLRAGVVALVGLGIASTFAAAYTGAYTAAVVFGSRPEAFLDTQLVDRADVGVALVKLLAYGFVIPVIAARAGLVATGGAPAVGAATTRGVVWSIVAVVFLELVIGGGALLLGI